MKKIIALAGFFLFMASCSNDDAQNTNAAEDTTLLKKMTSTNEEGITSTYDYTYNGNKIVSMIGSNGSSSIYTYTGNLITNYIRTTEEAFIIQSSIEYDNSNRKISEIDLITQTESNYESGRKTLYTYNQNGTVTINTYIGDLESQTTFDNTYTITQADESLIQFEGDFGSYSHVFDTNNNPMKNVTGYNEFMKPSYSSKNNLLYGYKEDNESGYIFTYTYNSNNYPVTSTQKIKNLGIYDTSYIQYFYE